MSVRTSPATRAGKEKRDLYKRIAEEIYDYIKSRGVVPVSGVRIRSIEIRRGYASSRDTTYYIYLCYL